MTENKTHVAFGAVCACQTDNQTKHWNCEIAPLDSVNAGSIGSRPLHQQCEKNQKNGTQADQYQGCCGEALCRDLLQCARRHDADDQTACQYQVERLWQWRIKPAKDADKGKDIELKA